MERCAADATVAGMRVLLALAASATLAACGGLLNTSPLGTRDGKCDLRPARPQCTDWREFKGPSMVAIQGLCNTLILTFDAGVWTEGARCDSAASLGGCQQTTIDGTKQTNWYYQGSKYPDAGAAMSECSNSQPWVDPQP